MKILGLSDRMVEAIHSPQIHEMYGDVALVIACGDLPYYYLEYVATLLTVPVVYVHGNHDKPTAMSDGRTITTPEGCISLEGRCMSLWATHNKASPLLLAGLGGSMLYNRESIHQYSEGEMRERVLALVPSLLMNRLRYGRFLDILVTHSPPFGIHDGGDLPHTGFKIFLTLMRFFRPRYLVHGHTHLYRKPAIATTGYHKTTVMNVYPSRVIEISNE